jgi:hypothetical protein
MHEHTVDIKQIMGKMTPMVATLIAGLKYFFSSFKSLSSPAMNIKMITPISAPAVNSSPGRIQFSKAGPSKMPTSS